MSRHANYKDFFLRKQYKSNQKKLIILKFFLFKSQKEKKNSFKFMLKLAKLHKALFNNRIKNRCMFSTKIRSVSRLSNLTKSSFRENLRWGKLNGFKKASW